MAGAPLLDAKAAEVDRIGLFGKVPARGDFVSLGLDMAVRSGLDRWLQAGLAAFAQSAGQGWAAQFRAMPAWRFIIRAGVWGRPAVAGVMMPSEDRVGRAFPIVVAAQIYDAGELSRHLYSDATWFLAAEGIAEAIGHRQAEAEQFAGMLKRLRLPRAQAAEGDGAHAPAASLWWKADPASGKAVGFKTVQPPKVEDFLRLFEGMPPAQPKSGPAPRVVAPEPRPAAAPVRLVCRHGLATHPGTRLSLNADALLSLETPRLLAVADGVGNGTVSADAARLVANALSTVEPQMGLDALAHEIKGKLGRAHGLIQAAVTADGQEPAAVSVVAAAIAEGSIAVAWAGDARCYLLRDGLMRCLTRDHVEVGIHRRLSNAVGLRRQFVPEIIREEAKAGDRLMLCSAPLIGSVPERQIAEILLSTPIDEAAYILLQEGLIGNCRDNLSAIVVEIASA